MSKTNHSPLRRLQQLGCAAGLKMNRIIRARKPQRYCVQWRKEWQDNSFLLFVTTWYDSVPEMVESEIDFLEDIKMNIFSTDLFPYIQGDMIKDAGKVKMTIKRVIMEKVSSDRGEQSKPVVYFQEKPKGLVLNKTNAKQIARLYGAETDDWIGRQIYIYAEEGTWFGKHGFAVRVSNQAPKQAANANGKQKEASKAPEVEVQALIDFDDLEDEPVQDTTYQD